MRTYYNFKDNDEREIERFVGIDTFNTFEIEGIGGIYKYNYKDFIVKEIASSGKILDIKEDFPEIYFSEDKKDRFTTFNLVKINKEPFKAFREIGRALKIPISSIHYSGLKDKTSISVQKVSIKGDFVEKLKNLKIRDSFFRCIIPTKKPMNLGTHWGNSFTITIRNIENKENLENLIKSTINKLKNEGFPNYFGLQRFGTFRPNTHLIGRYLFEGNFKNAYNEFVTTVYSSESVKVQNARKNLKETGDLEKALEEFPKSLNYERTFIEYLITHPDDYEGCFKTISRDLKNLILNAFQSYLFNKMVSFRLKKGPSLIEGDTISILDDINGFITQTKYVYGGPYDKYLEDAINLNRAVIIIPIVGYDTDFNDFPLLKPVFQQISEENGININLFRNETIFNAEFKGSYRAMMVKPNGLEILKFEEDDVFPGKKKLKIEFSLQKGSYATMLIRELIK